MVGFGGKWAMAHARIVIQPALYWNGTFFGIAIAPSVHALGAFLLAQFGQRSQI